MQFNEALTQALAQNNGRVTFEQVVHLLPNHGKHKVMTYLNAAKNEGVCNYTVAKEGNEMVIVITSPNRNNPPASNPLVSSRPPQSGGNQ